jgi:hypothetical protein
LGGAGAIFVNLEEHPTAKKVAARNKATRIDGLSLRKIFTIVNLPLLLD